VTRAFDEMSKNPTPIELGLGPEDYPFGEEKALLEVVEGPGPLHREADNPPYVKGLFITDPSEPNPTGVNNVGTLFHTSSNKARHSSGTTGTPDSPGTMTLRNELAKHGFPAVWQILLDTADTEPVRMHPCAANRLDHRKGSLAIVERVEDRRHLIEVLRKGAVPHQMANNSEQFREKDPDHLRPRGNGKAGQLFDGS
jgi:hypothetical protein